MVFKIHMDLKTFVFAAGARIPMGVCERPRVGPTVGRGVHRQRKEVFSRDTSSLREMERRPDMVTKRQLQRLTDLGQLPALLLSFCVPL